MDLVREWLPQTPGGWCLDFGCGNGHARKSVEAAGYRWVGIDLAGASVAAYADAHSLPFPSSVFDLAISIAVLEHLHTPWRACSEVRRVLNPGGIFAGTVAFLEPFHGNSYFHMTHLGVQRLLEGAGFEVLRVFPGWHVLQALLPLWWFIESRPRLALVYRGAAGRFSEALMAARIWRLRKANARKNQALPAEALPLYRLTYAGSVGFVARASLDPNALR